ncbi:hypothetical protein AMK68_04095 [candidate division KD3-62 bacterium DG_56]|uniref:Uncharacterized protein n=1 Tax=candidate division KD3-62 bacterium DG_56 TaxID=1704032 RepID=A0A0S7XLZ8_9BACT|nr:MAG: hypothetical protein AMK68_04095 [candidate division KD3-62 bacterium DG_56]
MWRITWQTGLAYLIFGSVYLGAYQILATRDWSRLSIATLAATGVLGWALVVTGGIFLIFTAARRLLRTVISSRT